MNVTRYICCPKCHSDVKKIKAAYVCEKCSFTMPIYQGIIRSLQTQSSDITLSQEKWNVMYKKIIQNRTYMKEYREYKRDYLAETVNNLNATCSLKNCVYLEIGCGPMYVGQYYAKECKVVLGVDISIDALLLARSFFIKNKIKNFLLIQADIRSMPIKNNVTDFIYGGGVIEHFHDTSSALWELHRVLVPKGICFNTVPLLNIGSLTYRQVWGNIPNIPVVRQLAEFIHIKLLGAKHMRFGYEMSFPKSLLLSLHKNVGFRKVLIQKYDVTLRFEYLPSYIRAPFIYLAKNSPLFWPMVKVIAMK